MVLKMNGYGLVVLVRLMFGDDVDDDDTHDDDDDEDTFRAAGHDEYKRKTDRLGC